MTILELAETIKKATTHHTQGRVTPKIEIVDKGVPTLFNPNEKQTLNVDLTKTMNFFGIKKLKDPKEVISEIVENR